MDNIVENVLQMQELVWKVDSFDKFHNILDFVTFLSFSMAKDMGM
jgi:hypothetical protein